MKVKILNFKSPIGRGELVKFSNVRQGLRLVGQYKLFPAGNKKILLATSALLLFIAFFFAQSAKAQEFSLGIYPPIIQIDALSPSKISTPITLENLSAESVTLSIQLKQFVPKELENGEITYIDRPDDPHKKMFSKVKVKENALNRSQITLTPKQRKNLNLEITLEENEPASDYYFSILFVSNPIRVSGETESYSSGAIASNILLSVGEKDIPKGRITDFSAPFFVTKGPVAFRVRVENQSPYFITTEGNIIIKNIFGQRIGNLELISSNILGKSARLLTNKEGAEEGLNGPKALWKEKFLLGVYTADLTISLSEQGPILRDRLTFIAVPLEIIIGFLIAIAMLFFIYKRVKAKMNNEL